jgi:hypothetical protein
VAETSRVCRPPGRNRRTFVLEGLTATHSTHRGQAFPPGLFLSLEARGSLSISGKITLTRRQKGERKAFPLSSRPPGLTVCLSPRNDPFCLSLYLNRLGVRDRERRQLV